MAEPSQQCSEKGSLHSHRSGPKSTCAPPSLEPNSLMVVIPVESVHCQHEDSQLLVAILISSVASMSIQLMVMDLNSAYCHYIQCEKKTPQ